MPKVNEGTHLKKCNLNKVLEYFPQEGNERNRIMEYVESHSNGEHALAVYKTEGGDERIVVLVGSGHTHETLDSLTRESPFLSSEDGRMFNPVEYCLLERKT